MTSCALVVGINKYPTESGMNELFGAVADAADFADWALHPQGGAVAPQHLYFWTFPAPPAPSAALAAYLQNPTPWRRPGTPTAAHAPDFIDISRTAFHMAQTLPGAGVKRIYVFFAGHGVQTAALGAERETQTCFVTNDFWSEGPTAGLIPCQDMRRGLLSVGFPEVVMFLDCCRSPVNFNQAAPSLGWPMGAVPMALSGVGHAAKQGEKAFEEPERQLTSRGAFSRVLIEGLRRSRDAANQLTMNGLESYVSSGVSRILQGRNLQQFPQFEYDRSPPYLLLVGPAISQLVPIIVRFTTLAHGTTVQLVDSNGAPVGVPLTAGPGRAPIDAEIGRLYSLETPDKSLVKPFKHEGPGATHVDL